MSRLMHKALIPNDLIPNTRQNYYLVHNTQYTTPDIPDAKDSQYLARNAASTQSQYSVRITGGRPCTCTQYHCVRDLVPNT